VLMDLLKIPPLFTKPLAVRYRIHGYRITITIINTASRRQYMLLILDGHESHINMKFINYCDENKILLAIYPPHSTRTLQPLDVAIFKPLATAYNTEIANFLEDCQGLSSITKRDFFRMFWQKVMTKNIKKAFECTGLLPFDPEKISIKFTKEMVERPSSGESSTSVLGAEDWRKIQALLKEVVVDTY
jgi:hypothetical protein